MIRKIPNPIAKQAAISPKGPAEIVCDPVEYEIAIA